MGDFLLTGSSQFDLLAGITQSLAGRVGRVELLPLSIRELQDSGRPLPDLETMLFTGGYPALHDRAVDPSDWFSNYVATYVERDVRQLVNVRDLGAFQTFVKMCAARTGQTLNLASLGADCGISAVTARQWLSVLEASYVVMLLRPHHRNFGKRLVKSPKLYFLDSGLAAWLLGVREAAALHTHAMRGALFETLVIGELLKQRCNAGVPSDLHYWRDSSGHEVDVLWETAAGLQAMEIKSGTTVASDWMAGLHKWQRLASAVGPADLWLAYAGEDHYTRNGCRVVGWRELPRL